ncbi:MAG TPA: dienelactone hydrolase family protein [Cellulomonas sp.]
MVRTIDAAAARWAGATAADAPVLVLLHGYGSHEGDLLALAEHLPRGLRLVAPRGPVVGGPGYAWAPLAAPGRPDPGPVREVATALADWIDASVPTTSAVALLGFSQGGLMTTQLLRARPDRFAAGVVLSGFSLGTTEPGDAALAARRPPVLFAHGDADPVIPADATARTSTWLAGHTAVEEHRYAGLGHQVSGPELADVAAFLERTL